MLDRIKSALVNLEIDAIERLVNEALKGGLSANDILASLRDGMEEVGKKFEASEYFFSELVMAGETMKSALAVLKPHLGSDIGTGGKVVIGTIEGDLHDIGKDIVSTLLTSAGLQVHDLGIDVPPAKFAEKAREVEANVVGVSALLSVTVPTIANVVEELKKAGIRDRVKVIAGGAAVRKEYIAKLGVDAAVNDAIEGVSIIKSWV